MDNEFEAKLRQLTAAEAPYTADAYRFVTNAVTYTVGKLPAHRHVSAQELLAGMQELAKLEYGALAREVLDSFGLRKAADAGKAVYLLIGAGLLSSSPEDSPEDFNIDAEIVPALPSDMLSIKLPEMPFID